MVASTAEAGGGRQGIGNRGKGGGFKRSKKLHYFFKKVHYFFCQDIIFSLKSLNCVGWEDHRNSYSLRRPATQWPEYPGKDKQGEESSLKGVTKGDKTKEQQLNQTLKRKKKV